MLFTVMVISSFFVMEMMKHIILALGDVVMKMEFHVAAEKQTFTVYEMNEFNQDSPAFLELSRQSVNKTDPETGAHIKALGDLVPFTNTVSQKSLRI